MNISFSRVSSYLNCPYSHYLGYEIGLKLRAPVRPLRFGTDFHKLLELRNNPKELKEAKAEIKETFYDLTPKFQTELGQDYPKDIFNIFSDYRKVYVGVPQPSVTEQQFNILMGHFRGEPLYFKGVIDELYRRKDRDTGEKYLKVGEHKTFNQKPDLNTLTMNAQKNLYAKACLILYGLLPRVVIWDYIHSSPAAEPIWLEKSQRFSSAKSTSITPYSYLRACKARGMDCSSPEVIAEANKYSGNIPNFFFRVEQDIVPHTVDMVWEDFTYTAKDIVRQGHKNKTKRLSRDCKWCSYRDICFTEMTQGNLPELIEREYVIEPRDDIENEERRVKDVRFSR